jgi:hypothetical protein
MADTSGNSPFPGVPVENQQEVTEVDDLGQKSGPIDPLN